MRGRHHSRSNDHRTSDDGTVTVPGLPAVVAGILFSAFALAFDLIIAALGMQSLTLGGRRGQETRVSLLCPSRTLDRGRPKERRRLKPQDVNLEPVVQVEPQPLLGVGRKSA